MIQLQNVSLELGDKEIFKNVTATINRGERIGVIGRNGAGKSTLFKLLAGRIAPSAGSIAIERGITIGYLPQEEILNSAQTVFDEVADFDSHESIQKTYQILEGLGFSKEMMHKHINELSTGWKMRAALAKLLLTDADLYLFDEPTNHLDLVTQQWFIDMLATLSRGFLLISHDRAYLEKSCTHIIEIERGHVTKYSGNLDAYLQYKEIQQGNRASLRVRQEREIARKQANIDRMRASAVTARQAQSMIKQIERIELVDVEPPLPTMTVRFPQPTRSGTTVLTFSNLSYSYGEKRIFQKISGEIVRGQRVAIVAANGVGKTTLLNCITGKIEPTSGSAQLGHAVRAAFFEQDQARVLDPRKTVFQEVRDNCAEQTEQNIRTILGAFLFSGDDIEKRIDMLSGGEKNRVAMVKVLLQRANFLILDEPTNHMDLYAKEILRQALEQYEGTILFVSHDLDFVNRLATHIMELTPTAAYFYTGNYDEFRLFKSHTAEQPLKVVKPPESQKEKGAPTLKGDHYQSDKEMQSLEKMIERLERDEKKYGEQLGELSYGSAEYTKVLAVYCDIQERLLKAVRTWEDALKTQGRK